MPVRCRKAPAFPLRAAGAARERRDSEIHRCSNGSLVSIRFGCRLSRHLAVYRDGLCGAGSGTTFCVGALRITPQRRMPGVLVQLEGNGGARIACCGAGEQSTGNGRSCYVARVQTDVVGRRITARDRQRGLLVDGGRQHACAAKIQRIRGNAAIGLQRQGDIERCAIGAVRVDGGGRRH